MSQDKVKLIDQEYYIDSDESFGCCKTDGNCSTCVLTDVCGDYQDEQELQNE